MSDSTEDSLTAAVLDAVGPRIKAMRQAKHLTLTGLAEATGISISTLSRLESGQRRASLELLLPLARTFGVPLDELVGAPATGDPRIHMRPIRRNNGMTIVPLSREAGGVQAFKHVLPPGGPVEEPDLKVHDGYEWLYVLSGSLRLRLGEHDLILGQGEAAEFNTRTPHWFGRAGAGGVEILSLFGPQGERLHVRASPKRSTD